jgi:hypothetical protein
VNCDRCNEPMIEIEHYGERLVGCIECNCWQARTSAFVVHLSVEDFQALRASRQTESVRTAQLPQKHGRLNNTALCRLRLVCMWLHAAWRLEYSLDPD